MDEKEERQLRTMRAAAALRYEQEQAAKLRDMPDLQKLVETHSTYDKITHEAWENYHDALAKWKARYTQR